MIGVKVEVPCACFRKGQARQLLETYRLPPPSTCYGFVLSLVGERDRRQHIGCRIAPCLLGTPNKSIVLRKIRRIKSWELQSKLNSTPDYQELLTGVKVVIWLDSTEEERTPHLEQRVQTAIAYPATVERFGGLSLGESTHLIDSVDLYEEHHGTQGDVFLLAEKGKLTLPVWVDHVGSSGTRYATGNLEPGPLIAPPRERMPQIASA